jgi:hypothetical protein
LRHRRQLGLGLFLSAWKIGPDPRSRVLMVALGAAGLYPAGPSEFALGEVEEVGDFLLIKFPALAAAA